MMYSLHKIRPIIFVFLFVEALDILTTIIGINYFGHVEINPIADLIGFNGLITFKILASIIAAFVMQVKYLKWGANAVTIITGLPVVWNIMLILT